MQKMKEMIQLINIEPAVGYLNFIGAPKEHTTTDDSQTLRGNITLKLNKSMKAKMMIVKFKGHSQVYNYNTISSASSSASADHYEMSMPLLPKLKTKIISKSTTFPAGEHTIPWELEIPNIYARSFLAYKRGSIQYKVELKISFGTINKKSITLSHPIIIYRHLVSSLELVSTIQTKTFEHTTNKFQYQIEVPSIICLEQVRFPILIKYNKPVKFIYTQIIQTEIYRCRNISKAEADMAITASKKNSTIMSGQTYESFKNGDSGLSKFFKRIQPVTLNTIDNLDHQQQVLPLLLLHELGSSLLLTPGIESPLVAIYHQLEVTFNFGHQEEIRAKIPVLVSSIANKSSSKRIKKYDMENQLHKSPLSFESIDTSSSKEAIYHSLIDSNSSQLSTFVVNDNDDNDDDDNISLKEALSDQNLLMKKSQDNNRRSMTPPLPLTPPAIAVTNRPKMLDTQLANTLKSNNTPISSPLMTPNRLVDYSQPLFDASTAFVGLPPPPRRARTKKEIIQEDNSRRTPTKTTYSRPISPVSLHTAPFDYYHGPIQPTSAAAAATSSRTTIVRLNQSKSSNTSSNYGSNSIQYKRRSNSIDNIMKEDDYSKLVKSHYVCAELPPIPAPAITRQKLPSIPTLEEKEEHRKTRMYYEDDESDEDEEEDEAEIYNFFLQQL